MKRNSFECQIDIKRNIYINQIEINLHRLFILFLRKLYKIMSFCLFIFFGHIKYWVMTYFNKVDMQYDSIYTRSCSYNDSCNTR